MEYNYKISIIIPTYNRENYLKNLIDSLIAQTIGFDNLEVILVDDCSTDNSRSIIKNYASKYNNIKPIFLEKNTGNPSIPRNKGIEHSTSPYILFIDADDNILPDYCSTLYEIAINEKADVVHCEHVRKMKNSYFILKSIEKMDKSFIEENEDDKLYLRGTVWGNLFKKSIITENHLRFEDTLLEDSVFAKQCYIHSNKVLKMPKYCGYIYQVDNNESLTHKVSLTEFNKFIEGFETLKNVLIDNNLENHLVEMMNIHIPMLFFMFFKLKVNKKEKKRCLEKIYRFEKSINDKITLKSKPLNILNNYLLKEQYSKVMIISRICGLVYENQHVKNFFFKNYSNIKEIELKILMKVENEIKKV